MKSLFYFILIMSCLGCQSSFLDVKPSMQTIVPSTLEDYSLLLLDEQMLVGNAPLTLNQVGSDEYFISDVLYNGFPSAMSTLYQKKAYTWQSDIYNGSELLTDWARAYQRILQVNVILDGLKKITISNKEKSKFDYVTSAAMFHRAFNYYALAQQYCPVYFTQTAHQNLGLPIRAAADPTIKVTRSNLKDTYQFIENDLINALSIMPEGMFQKSKFEPNKQSILALLTRMYMQMGDYSKVEEYGKACLKLDNTLLDYNSINSTQAEPFPQNGIGNPEVLFFNRLASTIIFGVARMQVSPSYYNLYEQGDLRKQLFFKPRSGNIVYSGNYSGNSSLLFVGLGKDEVYLNLAEALARNKKTNDALDLLNTLRKHRFEKEQFKLYVIADEDVMLAKILEERKRQLYFRSLRWEDLRRLNKEERFQVSLHRVAAGKEYILEANAKQWTWPLPPAALMNGGYQPNL